MDLTYTPEQQAFRAEVRAWLDAHVPSEPLEHFDATREGFEAHRQWEKTLKSGDWGMVTWPREYGGRGLDLIQWLIFEEEYYRAGAPGRVNQNGIFLLGPTLIEFGTHEQKQRFLPKMASGEEIWAQAWSEPMAGSDLAGVRATAVREGDEYILNGHKIWSSRAVFADWAFGLFREPGSERHKGMSLIFFPLNAPGVTVNAIKKINGHVGFAEIFLENVRVPAFNRLGEEGQGWHICMATAGFERGLMLRSPARYQVAAKKLAELWTAHKETADPNLEADVVRAHMNADAYALNIYQTASRLMAGAKIGPEASTNKIFWSELDIHLTQTALNILGPQAELTHEAPDANPVDWIDDYIFALAGPIYAGSNEIQRNIIAERMLGLPR
ncbi:acyl-CoA dehydrogenase [Sphingomonadales bacterium 56]|uniref:acyl-CoA dehydrogenase n=1 Tax=unclassified Sphingobium TaxID=2611147 RepID=UPI0019198590|nr:MULTISPECIES: acyl-CoA dehydrogenase [unclassified Sphingobium]MBY2930798.1 acyl-CoA dehydrogenase [Sphingomonadales bacterium 56]MBY2960879.1 acyl-CoA dehydrogenase [Sphingomonadales bacterium 58]CAD7342033.1 Putative acyl-CoA dehydrogenase FadE17 [Sphingobium sp. S6]CAD7342082.1 Putative acyl-CoA dehydrogenase FadE17 [Sphingobium sp. S8]